MFLKLIKTFLHGSIVIARFGDPMEYTLAIRMNKINFGKDFLSILILLFVFLFCQVFDKKFFDKINK